MRRWLLAGMVVGVSLVATAPADAQWFGNTESKGSDCPPNWWDKLCSTWEANNMWPQPYVMTAREAVRCPLNLMAEKGWHRQNLLGSVHFEPGSSQLNQAGEMKVRSILTHSPPSRRVLFVERGATPEITTARLDAVQNSAAHMLPMGYIPEVIASNMVVEGTPADDADAVLRGFTRTRPDPRLPATSTESSNAGENN
jgi:hypothetical protein